MLAESQNVAAICARAGPSCFQRVGKFCHDMKEEQINKHEKGREYKNVKTLKHAGDKWSSRMERCKTLRLCVQSLSVMSRGLQAEHLHVPQHVASPPLHNIMTVHLG